MTHTASLFSPSSIRRFSSQVAFLLKAAMLPAVLLGSLGLGGCGPKPAATGATTSESSVSAGSSTTGDSPSGAGGSQDGTASSTSATTSLDKISAEEAEPAVPPRPATLREATAIIDLTTFPTLAPAEVHFQIPSKVGYVLGKQDFPAAVAFYRHELKQAGWKIQQEDVNEEKGYGLFTATKQGYTLSASIVKDPNSGKWQAFVENYGNVDAARLPRPSDAKLTQKVFYSSIYTTKETVKEAAKFIRTSMLEHGWRELVPQGGGAVATEESDYLHFMQGGVQLTALVNRQDDETNVMYGTSLLKLDLPIMPATKSKIEYMDEPFVHLFYGIPAKADEVLEFHRKELADRGWTVRTGSESQAEGLTKMILESPGKKPLRFEILSKDDFTFILFASLQDE